MRIGYGWDSHEFKRGIPLKIGGVTLPHDKGLGGRRSLGRRRTPPRHHRRVAGSNCRAGYRLAFLPLRSTVEGRRLGSFFRGSAEARARSRLRNRESRLHVDSCRSQDRPSHRCDPRPRCRNYGSARRLHRNQGEDARGHGHRQCGNRACNRSSASSTNSQTSAQAKENKISHTYL